MKHPIKITKEPLNFDNYVVYIRDADDEYLGYIMCPDKESLIQMREALIEWSKSQKKKADFVKEHYLTK